MPELEAECQRMREAICAIYNARQEEDFDGLMGAIDDAFAEATISALRVASSPQNGEA